MDVDQVHQAIVASIVEQNDLLCEIIQILSLGHRNSSSPDACIAFCEVLSNCVGPLRSAIKLYYDSTFFVPKTNRKQILPSIDINVLDSTVIIDIILKVDHFFYIRQRQVAQSCQAPNHRKKCCPNCDHSSPTCTKCARPATNCKHDCRNCSKTHEYCYKILLEICCSSCQICIACNQISVNSMTQLTFQNAPCKAFMFLHCLKILQNWRNLSAHGTIAKLQQFMNGTPLPDFAMCQNVDELFKFITSALGLVMDFVGDKKRFPRHALGEDKRNSFKDNFECIFKMGKPLKKYLLENSQKSNKELGHSYEIISSKDEIISSKDEIISSIDEIISSKDEIISSKDQTISSKDQTISSKDQTISSNDQTISSKDQTINSKDEIISSKDEIISSKDEIISSKDKIISSNDQTISSKDQTISSNDQTISSKDQTINSKDETISSKDEIISSKDEIISSKDKIISSNDQTISSKDQTISSKDQTISSKDQTINSKDEIIERLKSILEDRKKLEDETKRFYMPLSITRDELPTDADMFHYKDIEVDGRLRDILMKAFHKSVKDVTQFEEDEDYEVEDIDCNFKSNPESPGKRSEIHFEVVIENAPRFNNPTFIKQISKEKMQKSKDLRQMIKSEIEAGISSKYGIQVEVGFMKWKFGSLIIRGGIFFTRGEFTEAQVSDILTIIKTVAANVFETTKPSVRIQTEIKVLNYSIIQLKLGIRLIDQKCSNKILEEEELIKEFFKKNIGAVLTKAYPLRLRPSEGIEGRRIQLTTNFFELTIPPNTVIHRYEVILREGINFDNFRKKKQRLVIETLVDRNKDVFKHRPVYDGRRCLYTKEPLQLGESNSIFVQIPDGDREQTFEVVLTWSAQVDMTTLQASVSDETNSILTGLNVILKHAAALRYASVSRGFYKQAGARPLSKGREIWPGFIVTARPTSGWKLVLNVGVSHKVFIKGLDVLDFLKEVAGYDYKRKPPLSNSQREMFKKEIEGLRIEVVGMPYKRKYRVYSVREIASDKDTFKMDDNTIITVSDYFRKEKSKVLKYPWLPCLHVGNKDRTIYLPLEVCRIVQGQHCNKKLTDEQKAVMIKHTARSPDQLKQEIYEIVDKDLNYGSNPNIKDFGIGVKNKMMSVNGRVLQSPGILYANDKTAVPIPKNGCWYRNHNKLYRGANIKVWGMVVFKNSVNRDEATKFEIDLMETAKKMGIQMGPPVYSCIVSENHSPEEFVAEAFETSSDLELLIGVLPENSPVYANLKRLCETELGPEKLEPSVRDILKGKGLSTQLILAKNVINRRSVCLEQLLLKINTKMGGINHTIDPKNTITCPLRVFKEPVMIMGADVNHPAGPNKTSPSIAAIIGSTDLIASRYAVTVKLQRNHMEMIEGMKQVTMDLLRKFYKETKKKPSKIIMYRDGVSEGQFQQVLYWEMKAMQDACTSLEKGYRPSITFIVVQKKHRARFFPTDQNKDRSGNCLPGTTIDTGVCHPTQFDYYQFGHGGIQGTSIPRHYHVLWDDSNFTADELQALSYMLCHLYARCTRPVSIPAPAYYAHLAAYRTRYYLEEADSEETSSVSSSAFDDLKKRIEQMFLREPVKLAKPSEETSTRSDVSERIENMSTFDFQFETAKLNPRMMTRMHFI